MPGWNTDRRSQLPDNWESELVPMIYVRDGAQCTYEEHGDRCQARGHQDARGRWRGLQVDHIRRGNNHSPSNLRLLCEHHHQIKSSEEGAEALARKREKISKSFQRSEPHPGSW